MVSSEALLILIIVTTAPLGVSDVRSVQRVGSD